MENLNHTGIEPVRDKLLVEDVRQASKSEHVTNAGIIIQSEALNSANSNAGKIRKCIVLGVGSGRVIANELVPLCAEPGDIVTIPNYAWTPFTLIEDKFTREYSFVRDEDVMGVTRRKVEEPKVEPVIIITPVVEPVVEPVVVEEPVVEEPVVEEPIVEEPVVETPVEETPAEVPVTEGTIP